MYICEKCGEVFEYPKIIGCPTEPDHGEGCPNCGSDEFDDAVICKVCGEWVAQSETHGGYKNEVCENCLHERDHDPDFLLKATEGCMSDIEVPALFEYVLDKDEIYHALYKAVMAKKAADDSPCKPIGYYEFDPSDFVDYYDTEIAEALIDEYQPEKGGAGDDKRVDASAS